MISRLPRKASFLQRERQASLRENARGTMSAVMIEILKSVRLSPAFSSRSGPLEEESLRMIIEEASLGVGYELTNRERDLLMAELQIDEEPFGVLQPLVDDLTVSDIIIQSYHSIFVQSSRSNSLVATMFSSQEDYERFVERLLMKAGVTYSVKSPIADGIIDGFARIHAVHSSISHEGPYLTIRLNRFSSVGISDLERKGLAPAPILRYLETLIRGGVTVLIVGEVGTGKTTLARALAAAVPVDESILVIEDTPEIQLAHPCVRYIQTRHANTEGEGRVSPSEVIRGGMRMAMNRIVFGEIRDPEAAEAFIDVCASGHPGLSTIHAKSASDALVRLQLFLGRAQRSVGKDVLMQQISIAVGAVCYVDVCRTTGQRRIFEIREIAGVGDGNIRNNELFHYSPDEDYPRWEKLHSSSVYKELLDEAGSSLHMLPQFLELNQDSFMAGEVRY